MAQPKKAGLPTAAVSREAGSESEISFRRRSVLIQGSKIFPDSTGRPFADGAPRPIMIVAAWYVVLPVNGRADDAPVRSEALSTHQTRVDACLEARDICITKRPCLFLEKVE